MIITILRKPLEGSVADNTLKYGCGALNIDATRISTDDQIVRGANPHNKNPYSNEIVWSGSSTPKIGYSLHNEGRWPANFILTHLEGCISQDEDWACVEGCPVKGIDQQSGVSKSTGGRIGNAQGVYSNQGRTGWGTGHGKGDPGFGDEGGASRFFKQFKGS